MIQSGKFDSLDMDIKKLANTSLIFIANRIKEIIGIIISILGILLLIALFSYSPSDPNFIFSDNTEIMATDHHPFYVDENYRTLEVGDEVLNDELNKVKVVSVEKIDGLIETYNINRTNNGKNYFANRVLVSDESDI